MKEVFLSYLWENKLLKPNLRTTTGDPIELISVGTRNIDSGPDFLQAKLKIGETIWVGNIEIHVFSSDWYKHGHDNDKAYQNVILHVVYEADKPVKTIKNTMIPQLELKNIFDVRLLERYNDFLSSKNRIACEKLASSVQEFTWLSWLDRLVIERLENKIGTVLTLFEQCKGDWEETFYRLLLRNFGVKANVDPFEKLASLLPLKNLLKHADNLLQIEAMLFGVSGLLEADFQDEYPKLLQREFRMLRSKFDLPVMPAEQWRFLRMRPANFPTIRLAQLATLIHRNSALFSKIKNSKTIAIQKQFFSAQTSSYWDTHYMFDKPSQNKLKTMGESSIDLLLINTVIPLLFFYGKQRNEAYWCEKAISMFDQLKPEKNNITTYFESIGVMTRSAMQSQALIELYTHYCESKRCLNCRIGCVLIQSF
ncbi:MAG: DUF2851 family protein [Lentimicrobiaceae bacterium]|nr:DUF2851 family protein [Lentimicrobiaceae bacterium]